MKYYGDGKGCDTRKKDALLRYINFMQKKYPEKTFPSTARIAKFLNRSERQTYRYLAALKLEGKLFTATSTRPYGMGYRSRRWVSTRPIEAQFQKPNSLSAQTAQLMREKEVKALESSIAYGKKRNLNTSYLEEQLNELKEKPQALVTNNETHKPEYISITVSPPQASSIPTLPNNPTIAQIDEFAKAKLAEAKAKLPPIDPKEFDRVFYFPHTLSAKIHPYFEKFIDPCEIAFMAFTRELVYGHDQDFPYVSKEVKEEYYLRCLTNCANYYQENYGFSFDPKKMMARVKETYYKYFITNEIPDEAPGYGPGDMC